jgi:hypothetical protein
MKAHVGIGGTAAPHYILDTYFVSVRISTGARVILELKEVCLDDAQPAFRL